jgi:DegV family protein with EDD domain
VVSDQQRVTVVTDSTADVPAQLASDLGIVVVPLRINFGQESFRDGIELTTEQLIERMSHSPSLPTTSQPTVGEFAAVFQDIIDAGRDIVCVTIGALLSGTYQAALAAAETVAPDRIAVIDGSSTTMHIGWAAVAGARIARQGADRVTVAGEVRAARERSNLFVVLKTLDYVYKGGRIGRVGQLVGSALSIKPIISVRDGRVTAIERVRTWKKALRRLVELTQDEGDLSDIIVLHVGDREDAEAMLSELRDLFPDANVMLGGAGAVIGTHVGPGAVAIATLRRA